MQKLFSDLEAQYQLPSGILNAVMKKESGGKWDAVSEKGALGAFQFMPATAEQYDVNVYDLTSSATGAAKYLSDLAKQFNGDFTLALAAYNAGPGNVRKYGGIPPFKQTVDYVSTIAPKVGLGDPTLDLGEDQPELDLGADDLDLGEEPNRNYRGESARDKNFDPSKFWQSDLDAVASTWKGIGAQVAGGVGGGIVGGIAGAATTNPLAAGAIALGGGALGEVGALALMLKDHPAPVSEKLEYLAKQGAFSLAVGGVLGNLGRAKTVFSKLLARTPSEADEVAAWFAKRGQDVKPGKGMMAGSARGVYVEAGERMEKTIQSEIVRIEDMLNVAPPAQIGAAFKTAVAETDKRIGEVVEPLFAPFKAGQPYGDLLIPIPQIQQEAKNILTTLEKQGVITPGEGGGALVKWMERAAAGKPVKLNELAEWKRGLYKIADFDEVGKSLEGAAKVKLSAEAEKAIQEALQKVDPAAARHWQLVNKQYATAKEALTNDMVKTLLKKDTNVAAEFMAKNATPDSMNALETSIREMRKYGKFSASDADAFRKAVQRNWIEANMKDPAQAAEMFRRVAGRGRDVESAEVFKAVFRTNPSLYKELLQLGKVSSRFSDWADTIPRGMNVGGGTYATIGSIGGLFGGQAGAAGAMSSLKAAFLLPGAAAKAAATGDRGIVNRAKYAMSYFSSTKPAQWTSAGAGATAMIPTAVTSAMAEVLLWARDQEEEQR